MDVKTAFLNAPIDCELYVEQPESFVMRGDDSKDLVLKLEVKRNLSNRFQIKDLGVLSSFLE